MEILNNLIRVRCDFYGQRHSANQSNKQEAKDGGRKGANRMEEGKRKRLRKRARIQHSKNSKSCVH